MQEFIIKLKRPIFEEAAIKIKANSLNEAKEVAIRSDVYDSADWSECGEGGDQVSIIGSVEMGRPELRTYRVEVRQKIVEKTTVKVKARSIEEAMNLALSDEHMNKTIWKYAHSSEDKRWSHDCEKIT